MPLLSCRAGCAACCIAPSITSPIPGMPDGKPAGVPCVQLDEQGRCRLFGRPERPAFCVSLQPAADLCGEDREQALRLIGEMERATRP
ncbi:MAG: YkgJ family cysteine cluster protein [Pseudomonadota bacterium]